MKGGGSGGVRGCGSNGGYSDKRGVMSVKGVIGECNGCRGCGEGYGGRKGSVGVMGEYRDTKRGCGDIRGVWGVICMG